MCTTAVHLYRGTITNVRCFHLGVEGMRWASKLGMLASLNVCVVAEIVKSATAVVPDSRWAARCRRIVEHNLRDTW